MVSKGITVCVAITCSISSRMTTCATPETSRSASMALRVNVGALSFANVRPSASTESRLIEASVNRSRSHRVTTDGRNSGIFTPPGDRGVKTRRRVSADAAPALTRASSVATMRPVCRVPASGPPVPSRSNRLSWLGSVAAGPGRSISTVPDVGKWKPPGRSPWAPTSVPAASRPDTGLTTTDASSTRSPRVCSSSDLACLSSVAKDRCERTSTVSSIGLPVRCPKGRRNPRPRICSVSRLDSIDRTEAMT